VQSARQQSRLIFKNATDSTERKSVKSVESVAFLLLDIGRKLHGFCDAVPAEFQIRETARKDCSCPDMKKKLCLSIVFVLIFSSASFAGKALDIYVIDTEGGKALLLVSPSGQSMLVDAGFPGYNDRDAIRIEEAAKTAGVRKFDFLVVTHYDMDHVNNVPATVARIPADTFMDHGPAVAKDPVTTKAVAAYLDAAAKAKRVVLKPGDKVPLKGLDVLVVTSAGNVIHSPVKGAGFPNPFCSSTPSKSVDTSENSQSVGLLYAFGKFRMLDLADLTWNKELELMCPNNPIGAVDLLMVSHHGYDASNSQALIHALHPLVTIMNNGPRKFGAAVVLKTIQSSPGLQAAYQLHWSENAPADNPPDEFIANLWDSPDGKWIKVSVEPSGKFTVTNARTGISKNYK
jgi:beta-lactamase superfamily II metal-dependent hydrolase